MLEIDLGGPFHRGRGGPGGWILLMEPERTLEVFKREGPRWTLLGTFAGDTRVRAEPFDAIELEPAASWTL